MLTDGLDIFSLSSGGSFNEPYSAKPAQRGIPTDPPGYIGRTRFQSM